MKLLFPHLKSLSTQGCDVSPETISQCFIPSVMPSLVSLQITYDQPCYIPRSLLSQVRALFCPDLRDMGKESCWALSNLEFLSIQLGEDIPAAINLLSPNSKIRWLRFNLPGPTQIYRRVSQGIEEVITLFDSKRPPQSLSNLERVFIPCEWNYLFPELVETLRTICEELKIVLVRDDSGGLAALPDEARALDSDFWVLYHQMQMKRYQKERA